MSDLAILGGGDIGGALAHRVASRGRFERVWLVDPQTSVAAGKALDILQAGPIENSTTLVTGGSLADVADADVIVVADRVGAPAAEWDGDEAVALVAEAAAVASRAVVICAGATHRRVIERSVRERGLARRRVLGSAPEALGGAARAALASMLDSSALDVRLPVAGVLPEAPVVLWSGATVGSGTITARLTPSDRGRFLAMLPFLWPPAAYALASAACRVAEACATHSRVEHTVWTWLDSELGVANTVLAVPARLGPAGVTAVNEAAFAPVERDELARAVAAPSVAR